MNLAVNPPVLPMLAKRVGELPPGDDEKEVRALLSDLETRDAQGWFLGCLVLMRCKGVRPI